MHAVLGRRQGKKLGWTRGRVKWPNALGWDVVWGDSVYPIYMKVDFLRVRYRLLCRGKS